MYSLQGQRSINYPTEVSRSGPKNGWIFTSQNINHRWQDRRKHLIEATERRHRPSPDGNKKETSIYAGHLDSNTPRKKVSRCFSTRIGGGGTCTGSGPTEGTGRVTGTKLAAVSRLGGAPARDANAVHRRLSAHWEDDAARSAKEAPVARGAVRGERGSRA